MKKPLVSLIGEIAGEKVLAQFAQRGFVDLTVTFVDPNEEEQVADDQKKLLEHVPVVRVTLKPTGK